MVKILEETTKKNGRFPSCHIPIYQSDGLWWSKKKLWNFDPDVVSVNQKNPANIERLSFYLTIKSCCQEVSLKPRHFFCTTMPKPDFVLKHIEKSMLTAKLRFFCLPIQTIKVTIWLSHMLMFLWNPWVESPSFEARFTIFFFAGPGVHAITSWRFLPTHLTNQNGNLPQVGVENSKNIETTTYR